MKLYVNIDDETLQDLISIHTGLYGPLTGFMTSQDYKSVVDDMRLGDNLVWTLPVTLAVDRGIFKHAITADRLYMRYRGKDAGFVEIRDSYKIDPERDIKKVFKTDSHRHPGVKKELQRPVYRIGGKTVLTDMSILKGALNPEKTKKIFREKGWRTIVGFQTRNPIHKAHEYLQRIGLDLCDGLFINPSIGWKRQGDFSEEAIMKAYKYMCDNFYPKDRIYLEGLRVYFRYAGPREAVFHAILRRNLGCTHFIIGRDHAGVGGYYGAYEAHDLAKRIMKESKLGIELLLLKEPYFCKRCGQIVTDKHCRHSEDNIVKISGSGIRAMLKDTNTAADTYVRPEIMKVIKGLGDKSFV